MLYLVRALTLVLCQCGHNKNNDFWHKNVAVCHNVRFEYDLLFWIIHLSPVL